MNIYDVIKKPLITEKTTVQKDEKNVLAFVVNRAANKIEIKAAVEQLFKVTVINVNVLTAKRKEKSRNRRRGRQVGYTSPWKKAVVTVKAGDSIEFFEGV